jgi:hypothetical protein
VSRGMTALSRRWFIVSPRSSTGFRQEIDGPTMYFASPPRSYNRVPAQSSFSFENLQRDLLQTLSQALEAGTKIVSYMATREP